VAEFPRVPELRLDLAGSYCNQGHLIRAQGHFQAAIDWYDKAIHTLTPVLATASHLAPAREFLSNSYDGRARALVRLKRYAEAVKAWDRALDFASSRASAELRMGRASAMFRAGDGAKALAEVDAIVAPAKVSPEVLYDAACLYALAAKDRTTADRFAIRALALLRRAQAAGYFRYPQRIAWVKKDPDLAVLRSRKDFQEWESGLEKAR